jgi:DNA-binding NtrC family response regulator
MGEFRSDLFYRLNIFPIRIPPLRERPDDVRPLVHHMLPLIAKRLGRSVPEIRESDYTAMEGHPWPGNVRQLQATLERSLIVSRGTVLEVSLPPSPRTAQLPEGILTQEEMRDREKRNLEAALAQTGGRLYGDGGAAELLGMKPTTLASRLKALGINRPK